MLRPALVVLATGILLSGCVSTVVGTAASTAVGVTGAVAGAGVNAAGKTAGAAGRTVFLVQPDAD